LSAARHVISVGYRLAPEAAFPAGLRDCYGVARWAAENGKSLKWDGATLAIAGDSSGGTFVAAVAAMARDDGFGRITHQVLYYPSLDLDFDQDRYASLRENAEGYGLETAALKPFNTFYIGSGADPADPPVSPIKRADLTGLPPALIITAEYDPLRDEGELYGRIATPVDIDDPSGLVAATATGCGPMCLNPRSPRSLPCVSSRCADLAAQVGGLLAVAGAAASTPGSGPARRRPATIAPGLTLGGRWRRGHFTAAAHR